MFFHGAIAAKIQCIKYPGKDERGASGLLPA